MDNRVMLSVALSLFLSTGILAVLLFPGEAKSVVTALGGQKDTLSFLWEEKEQAKQEPKKTIVVLDPGHGGTDPGAVFQGAKEKTINRMIAEKTKAKLEDMGYEVHLTRSGDQTKTKKARTDFANDLNADYFISIHANSAEGDASGIETFYRTKKQQQLAQHVQTQLIEVTGATDRGAKKRTLFVLEHAEMPSVLIELGFLTDAAERRAMQENWYQELLSEGIARGIQAADEEAQANAR